jgi:hypothetical protein
MTNVLKRLTVCIVVGMLIFMPTGIAQVQKRLVCGKVILNTTEAVALTEVYIYFPNADLIPAAGAEPDGTFCIETFIADLSKTMPAHLYVTSLCRPNDLTLVDVPYWSALRKEPRFSGKRIMVGPGSLISVGSVDNQIVYGHVTLRILDQRQRALLTEKMDWSPLWIRVRGQDGVTVEGSGLSSADIDRSVDLKESYINLALPKGTWSLEVALAGVPPPPKSTRGVKWRRVPGTVKVESCRDPVGVTLTVQRMSKTQATTL